MSQHGLPGLAGQAGEALLGVLQLGCIWAVDTLDERQVTV